MLYPLSYERVPRWGRLQAARGAYAAIGIAWAGLAATLS